MPKFLNIKLYKNSIYKTSLYRNWQHKLLNEEIKEKSKQLTKHQRNKEKHNRLFIEKFSNLDQLFLRSKLVNQTRKLTEKIKEKQTNKLLRLGINN